MSNDLLSDLKKNSKLLDVPYGDHPLNKLDIYMPKASVSPPYGTVFMVHGGGWRRGSKSGSRVIGNKPSYFGNKGYVFVSLDYRLAPEDKYPKAAFDVARAIAFIHSNKDALKIDINKNVLIGHSAGAHLANLVGVKPQFLEKFQVPQNSIKLIISLDTYFYDVERVYLDDGRNSGRIGMIRNFFGTDRALMRDGSPLRFVGQDDPPMILFNRYSRSQKDNRDAESMVSKLLDYNIPSERHVFDIEHNDFLGLGISNHPTTNKTDVFMESLGL